MRQFAQIIICIVFCAALFGCSPNKIVQRVTATSNLNNLAINGEFMETTKDWEIIGEGINPYHPEDPGRAAFSIEDGNLKINISDPGSSIWSIMLYQSIDFKKGHTYTIKFDARADEPTTMVSNITQDNTWVNYSGDQSFVLSTDMQTYSFEFVPKEDITALFQLCLGNDKKTTISLEHVLVIEN
jgi:hypothetical protein